MEGIAEEPSIRSINRGSILRKYMQRKVDKKLDIVSFCTAFQQDFVFCSLKVIHIWSP